MERLIPYPTLRDLTKTDLIQFMQTLAKPDWKINDVSIANVGRHPTSKALLLQFSDDFSPAKSKPKNIFYNRYNIFKHIPITSFINAQEYQFYPKLLAAIETSKDHLRDLRSFIEIV